MESNPAPRVDTCWRWRFAAVRLTNTHSLLQFGQVLTRINLCMCVCVCVSFFSTKSNEKTRGGWFYTWKLTVVLMWQQPDVDKIMMLNRVSIEPSSTPAQTLTLTHTDTCTGKGLPVLRLHYIPASVTVTRRSRGKKLRYEANESEKDGEGKRERESCDHTHTYTKWVAVLVNNPATYTLRQQQRLLRVRAPSTVFVYFYSRPILDWNWHAFGGGGRPHRRLSAWSSGFGSLVHSSYEFDRFIGLRSLTLSLSLSLSFSLSLSCALVSAFQLPSHLEPQALWTIIELESARRVELRKSSSDRAAPRTTILALPAARPALFLSGSLSGVTSPGWWVSATVNRSAVCVDSKGWQSAITLPTIARFFCIQWNDHHGDICS